ncbi:MAG: DUF4238 domain-containing protein, partial [Candidatus Methanomethylophilaceae archaeon]|nr:DUF4238 domain-containing protein [Candidatus Methanomethylophilaceae archaeon]
MVRNHYNQQARLREFAREEGRHWKLTMVDLERRRVGSRNVETAFYEEGLYSDELERELNKKVEAPGMKVFGKVYDSDGYVLLSREEVGVLKKYLLVQQYRNPNNISHYSPGWEGDTLGFNEKFRDGPETYREYVCRMRQEICDRSWGELICSEKDEIRINFLSRNNELTMFVRTDLEFAINDLGHVTERHDWSLRNVEMIKEALRKECNRDGRYPSDEDLNRHLGRHQYIDNFAFFPMSSNVGTVTINGLWNS